MPEKLHPALYDAAGNRKFPKPEVARIHSHAPERLCPRCKLRWRECQCVMTPKLKAQWPSSIKEQRPWGYKGVQKLPADHPDSPEYKGKK